MFSLYILVSLIITTFGAPAVIVNNKATQNNSSLPISSSNTFRVSQVDNPTYLASGPAAYARSFLKFSGTVPEALANAIPIYADSAATNGTVTATPLELDSQYLCPVEIGTPAQTLFLSFDTGSSDLWVFSTETPSDEVNNQVIYRPSDSSTAELLNDSTWDISYADNSFSSGDVYLDTVSIGPLTVTHQAVESALDVSSTFAEDSVCSGLLGLAFDTLNTVKPKKQSTFLTNVLPSLASPLFTVNLKKDSVGNYNFGSIDSSEYIGNITYTPVTTKQGFWQFKTSGYAIGSTGSFVNRSINAIADTGTTLLLLPEPITFAYWSAVVGAAYNQTQGGYVFPCNAALPDFIFGIGTYHGMIPGQYFNFSPVNETTCFGGIQSSDQIGVAIFGDIALKSQFVVFDVNNTRLGWAAKELDS